MSINHKRLYESLTNEALVEELIEESSESHLKLSFELDDYYSKIDLMKEEIIKRMSK